MRIAVISDIHGNLVALDAVLADLAGERLDRIVCLGDVATGGPQPAGALARLRELACPVVMGNADVELLGPPPDPPVTAGDDLRRLQEIGRWCRDQLSADDVAYLRTFQPTVELPLADGATLLCCHGSPRSYDDVIAATTPDAELVRLLDRVDATVVAGGHTHVQLVRRHRATFVVNPGSVGLPMDRVPSWWPPVGSNAPPRDADPATGDEPVHNAPWAEYAVVAHERGRLTIDLRRTPVDVETLVRVALEEGMPHAAWYAGE